MECRFPPVNVFIGGRFGLDLLLKYMKNKSFFPKGKNLKKPRKTGDLVLDEGGARA